MSKEPIYINRGYFCALSLPLIVYIIKISYYYTLDRQISDTRSFETSMALHGRPTSTYQILMLIIRKILGRGAFPKTWRWKIGIPSRVLLYNFCLTNDLIQRLLTVMIFKLLRLILFRGSVTTIATSVSSSRKGAWYVRWIHIYYF